MFVKDIMTSNVELLDVNATIMDAAKRMKQLDVGAIPVRNQDRLAGMVTDRDIVVRGIASGEDISRCPLSKIMSSPIVYAYEDQDVQDIAKLMHDKKIRRLPILNRDKRLVGVVSLGDIATTGKESHAAGEALEGVSESA